MKYLADDGTVFETAHECECYERTGVSSSFEELVASLCSRSKMRLLPEVIAFNVNFMLEGAGDDKLYLFRPQLPADCEDAQNMCSAFSGESRVPDGYFREGNVYLILAACDGSAISAFTFDGAMKCASHLLWDAFTFDF